MDEIWNFLKPLMTVFIRFYPNASGWLWCYSGSREDHVWPSHSMNDRISKSVLRVAYGILSEQREKGRLNPHEGGLFGSRIPRGRSICPVTYSMPEGAASVGFQMMSWKLASRDRGKIYMILSIIFGHITFVQLISFIFSYSYPPSAKLWSPKN